MEIIKIGPIPKLVKLSHEYSNVTTSIYVNTSTFFKNNKLGEMTEKELGEMIQLIGKLQNGVDNLNDALEFTLTTGKQIEILLNQHNISNIKLAEILGVSVVTVSRWINGVTGITKENLEKIANYFGVTVEFLTGKNCFPSYEFEIYGGENKLEAIEYLRNFGITNLDKKILKECGYYLIDPYSNHEYYRGKIEENILLDNQHVNEKEWIQWVTKISMYEEFPQKIALIKLSELDKMHINYWANNDFIVYSEKIKNKAQYVDFKQLKCIIEDRKSMLAFNFEKSLESIK